MSVFVKDPAARIDYAVDWLAAAGDGQVIADSLWSVTPDEAGGLTVASHAFDIVRTAVTLAGGIAGHVYRVANRVTMAGGGIDERSLVIRVEER